MDLDSTEIGFHTWLVLPNPAGQVGIPTPFTGIIGITLRDLVSGLFSDLIIVEAYFFMQYFTSDTGP